MLRGRHRSDSGKKQKLILAGILVFSWSSICFCFDYIKNIKKKKKNVFNYTIGIKKLMKSFLENPINRKKPKKKIALIQVLQARWLLFADFFLKGLQFMVLLEK